MHALPHRYEAATPSADDPRCISDTLSYDKLSEVLTSGRMRREEGGRYFVLLSLAEAETIRCILHMRQGKSLIEGSDAAVALRCIPAHDALFDASANHPAAPQYMRGVSHNSFRFVDCAMHFKPAELNVLLRVIPAPPRRAASSSCRSSRADAA